MIINITQNKSLYSPITDNQDGTYYVRWGYKEIDENTAFWVEDLYYSKPKFEMLQDTILDWYNKKVDEKILSGFKWKDMEVWLSTENQFNYKAAFDLAIQMQGQNLPIKFKFGKPKDPTYYTFTTIEDLQDFYLSAMTYINQCLDEGWQEKDSIDWDKYNIDKILKEQESDKKLKESEITENEISDASVDTSTEMEN